MIEKKLTWTLNSLASSGSELCHAKPKFSSEKSIKFQATARNSLTRTWKLRWNWPHLIPYQQNWQRAPYQSGNSKIIYRMHSGLVLRGFVACLISNFGRPRSLFSFSLDPPPIGFNFDRPPHNYHPYLIIGPDFQTAQISVFCKKRP